jgi:hypothetical protein
MQLIAGRTKIGTYHEIAASTHGIALVAGVSLAPNGMQPDQRLTVDDMVRQFGAFHEETSAVYWTSEAAECRVTFDGSDPTASNGHIIPAGASGTWSVAMAAAARFIRTTATSAIIHASQLR